MNRLLVTAFLITVGLSARAAVQEPPADPQISEVTKGEFTISTEEVAKLQTGELNFEKDVLAKKAGVEAGGAQVAWNDWGRHHYYPHYPNYPHYYPPRVYYPPVPVAPVPWYGVPARQTYCEYVRQCDCWGYCQLQYVCR